MQMKIKFKDIKMIKYIIHIADLHIPNSEENRPYMEMLKQGLAEVLKEVKKHNKDEVRIVVAGDIFHNKIKTSNEAKKMFHETLNYLNAIAKTIIIAGNHDLLEAVKGISEQPITFDVNQGDNIARISYQNGMFSFSGLDKDQVEQLRKDFGLYIVGSGRICVAGINTNNII